MFSTVTHGPFCMQRQSYGDIEILYSLMEAAWDVYLALLNEAAAFKNRLNTIEKTLYSKLKVDSGACVAFRCWFEIRVLQCSKDAFTESAPGRCDEVKAFSPAQVMVTYLDVEKWAEQKYVA